VVSKGIDDDKPWLKKDDPLLDFLLSLMRERHYQQQMLHSRLRAKVFYSAVGKFVMECVHYEDFQQKRAWSEYNRMEKVLDWSAIRKADSKAVPNLLDDISARYANFGFDKTYFERLMSDEKQQQKYWEKLVSDWRKALERSLVHTCQDYIERRKEDFEKKVTIASEKRKELFSKLKNKLENESKDILKCENKPENIKKFENILKNEKFQKKYFRAGQYMTVGYLEFEDIDDCKDKIKILQYALNLLLKI